MSDMFNYEQSDKNWSSSVRWRPTTLAGWIVSVASFLFIGTVLQLVGLTGAIPIVIAIGLSMFIGSRVGRTPSFWLLLIPTFIIVTLAIVTVWVVATGGAIQTGGLLYFIPLLAFLISLIVAKQLTKRKP